MKRQISVFRWVWIFLMFPCQEVIHTRSIIHLEDSKRPCWGNMIHDLVLIHSVIKRFEASEMSSKHGIQYLTSRSPSVCETPWEHLCHQHCSFRPLKQPSQADRVKGVEPDAGLRGYSPLLLTALTLES